MVARRGKRPKNNFFFCIFGLLSYRYNIYQVRMEFRKLFYILVHPYTHACFPNTKINTTRKYTNAKYIVLEIIPKCYQILGPIGKNIMHILTGCPWNHFGCQSLKERFFLQTPCIITIITIITSITIIHYFHCQSLLSPLSLLSLLLLLSLLSPLSLLFIITHYYHCYSLS